MPFVGCRYFEVRKGVNDVTLSRNCVMLSGMTWITFRSLN
jgi:hypothetical protein